MVLRLVPRRGLALAGATLGALTLFPAGLAPATPAGAAGPSGPSLASQPTTQQVAAPAVVPSVDPALPLAGITVAIDPGHNPGNFSHPRQINKRYWVGLWKTCNTTGTATNSGYREANYTWAVQRVLRARLTALGATVVVDRGARTPAYGPCVRERGRFGTAEGADLKISIHADGGPASGRGFHVIAPRPYVGYTDDIAKPSRRLATAVVAGMIAAQFRPATYLSTPIQVRKDQGTLNMSDVPTVIVETLNMRNSRDAAIATSKAGRARVADGLLRGIRGYLGR
ncbi:MAG: N-acetylmuramoyl-L-alanine amidase [Actinomycetota bacterium]|nr:MAG: N-acetylmuramoyl-L-alanine amidase [Actinomycetota bacterium]